MLHVTDQRVVPIDEVQASVGSDFQVTRTEVAIGRLDQVLAEFAFDLNAVFHRLVLLDSQEANCVGVHVVALNFIGEVTAVEKLRARCWTSMVFVIELRNLWNLF